jgi:hypothetical protein
MEKSAMKFFTNIAGKVRNTTLHKTKPLLPLFEVVTNAIHAIEESKNEKGLIEIEIIRNGSKEALLESSNVDQYPIKSFVISDNGIGFTKKNFESFLTSDSDYKIEKGAKGVGRFVCLKAFKSVEVESFYTEGNVNYLRSFEFRATGDGIFNYKDDPSGTQHSIGTKISLMEYYEEYQTNCPKALHVLSQSLIEHFLIYFLTETCPKIVVKDSNGIELNLNDEYKRTIRQSIDEKEFEIKGQKFFLNLLKIYNNITNYHSINYCANERVVLEEKLNNYITDLGNKITDEEGNKFVYQVYISSQFLNQRVNSERTGFNILEVLEKNVIATDISLEEIRIIITQILEGLLSDFLKKVRTEKIEQFRNHVNEEAPQFGFVFKYAPEKLNRIPATTKGNKLNIELFKIQSELEQDLKERGQEFLEQKNDITQFDDYKKKYEEFINQFNDLGKANLTKYIVHRKSVIELLDLYLGKQDEGTFMLEDTIHNIFFPIKKESDEITYEKQNLWLIDERLTYHYYLSSDLSLQKSHVVSTDNTDRPDLLIFNDAFTFVNDDAPFQSFVIVEFKRPERANYNEKDEKKNPIDQVISYIRTIRNSEATDRKGKTIAVGKENINFYAYIICDFNNNLNEIIENKDFKKTPDGMGYFYFHKEYNAYIEIISYQKLLKDAKKRNRILFDKLGLSI